MDMAVAASSAAQLVVKIRFPESELRLKRHRNNPAALPTLCLKKRACLIRAAKPGREEEQTSNENGPDNSAFLSQEDLSYLTKLGAGSVAGAAAIKYGSVVFPEITRPNIVEALSIISFPVVVAVLLLFWQSRSE
ncbi:OLC1v1037525C1 [Oldenlandia corymbosa var. corymbosa]|uniref:OLC1v1037525C1 n=1 Tax=Oldenlandia corymbosa var. corymbosa TaxID=529605 RepID=A0AAV1E169_OLDCO|nr:OLC1v1037525C1 [Oldenlandia corymbosa var. corymbosa]